MKFVSSVLPTLDFFTKRKATGLTIDPNFKKVKRDRRLILMTRKAAKQFHRFAYFFQQLTRNRFGRISPRGSSQRD
jgi:hypothetical protein